MASASDEVGGINVDVQEHRGPFEADVEIQDAAAVRAARLDAFLDRVEAAAPGACPCCGRPMPGSNDIPPVGRGRY